MENIVREKSKAFAVRIVRLSRYLSEGKKEFIISKQILKSGTSIGANIREASRAQSTADFISKMNIALKEADETCYWLEILYESEIITQKEFSVLYAECEELLKILVSIIKTTRNNGKFRIKS